MVALVLCDSTGEIGDALNRALDQVEQALALAISVRDGIAPDVRLGDHAWKVELLRARAVSLAGFCDCITAADSKAAATDAAPSLTTGSREAA
ncbi:hypothetical protein ASF59_09790 [Methylobacterium sp. Leaf121]|nr:hypothetical protein ASF59_09790 [Methylobacterium sp. Leaf121]